MKYLTILLLSALAIYDPLAIGFLPLLAGASALYTAYDNAKKERAYNKEVRETREFQKGISNRWMQGFERQLAEMEALDAQGFFDPTKRIESLTTLTNEYRDKELNAIGGAAKMYGNKPGDSVPMRMLATTSAGWRQYLDRWMLQIQDQLFAQRQQGYAGAYNYLQGASGSAPGMPAAPQYGNVGGSIMAMAQGLDNEETRKQLKKKEATG